MIDILKKSIYAGIGATVLTAERIESALSELVEKGKLSSEEAQSIAKKIADDGKKEFDEVNKSLKKSFEEFLDKTPVVRKSELEPLRKRIELLEKEIEALKKEPKQ